MGDPKEFDEVKGRVEEAAGDLTDDDELKRKGKVDRLKADVKEKVDEAGEKVKEGIDRLRRR